MKHHPQQVQEERKYLDRENQGKIRIQKILEAENISFNVHGAKDMEKGENSTQELGNNLMCTQKEMSNLKEMIMELKPKSGATVKEFSSPVDDTERTNDLEMVISGT